MFQPFYPIKSRDVDNAVHHPLYLHAKSLLIPERGALVIGSFVLLVYGLRETIGDIDFVLTKETWEVMKSRFPKQVSRTPSGVGECIRIETRFGLIEFFNDWPHVDVPTLFKNSVHLPLKLGRQLHMASITDVLTYKRKLPGFKHQSDALAIEIMIVERVFGS